MAFDYTNLYPDTSGNGGFTKTWNYTTVTDSIATCSAVGYFNKVATRLGIGDNIVVAQVDAFDKARTALIDKAVLFVTGISNGVVTTNVFKNGLENVPNVDTTNSANINFLQSGTGAVTRTMRDKAREAVSVKDFGAVGDGSIDDRAAISNADSNGAPIVLTSGTYNIGASNLAVNSPIFYDGGSIGGAGTMFSAATQVGVSGVQWYQRSDRNASSFTGTPTVYTNVKSLMGSYDIFNNAAGYQQFFNTDSGGRTQISPHYSEGTHSGYGDLVAWSAAYGITKHASAASVTTWVGQNAATVSGGQIGALSTQVNLFGAEYHLVDNGFGSVAGLGAVLDFNRTALSGSYTAPWLGVRCQSTGTTAADAGYQLTGPWNVGTDYTGANFGASNAAVALTAGQRIYFNAQATVPGTNWYAGNGTTLNNDFINYSASAINLVVNNNVSLAVFTDKIVASVPTVSFNSAAAFTPSMTLANSANDANPPIFNFSKSRAGAAVQVNDVLGGIFFGGLDATPVTPLNKNGAFVRALATAVAAGSVTAKLQLVSGASIAEFDSGVFRLPAGGSLQVNSTQVVGARVTGYTAMTGTPDKATALATSTVTLAQLAGRVMQIQSDLTTHGLIGA